MPFLDRSKQREANRKYYLKNIERLRETARRKARERYPAEAEAKHAKYVANAEVYRKYARDRYHATKHAKLANTIWHTARQRARKKKIPFEIVVTDITIPPVCPILKTPMEINLGRVGRNSPTLDRIRPHDGYIRGNIIVVSMLANAIKCDATPEQILAVGKFYADLEEQKSRHSPSKKPSEDPDCHTYSEKSTA